MVGTLDRWNDGKKSEWKDRTKSPVEGYSQQAKALRELEKQKHLQDNQDEYHKTIQVS